MIDLTNCVFDRSIKDGKAYCIIINENDNDEVACYLDGKIVDYTPNSDFEPTLLTFEEANDKIQLALDWCDEWEKKNRYTNMLQIEVWDTVDGVEAFIFNTSSVNLYEMFSHLYNYA